MVFRPDANQGRRAFPSRNKVIPYLTVHCRRTERIAGGDLTATATVTVTTTASVTLSICPYNEYLQGQDGGPIVDYWWTMSETLDVSYTAGVNYGAAGIAPLYFKGKVDTASASSSPVVLQTCNGLSLWRDRSDAITTDTRMYADIPLTSSSVYTQACWVKFPAITVLAQVFSSNVGGSAAYSKGLTVFIGADRSVTVRGSSNSNARINWTTTASAVTVGQSTFIALRVNSPSANSSLLDFDLFLNATKRNKSDLTADTASAVTIAYPMSDNTQYAGEKGVGFGYGDGQTDTIVPGYIDEPFLHFDAITDAQLLEIYTCGITNG